MGSTLAGAVGQGVWEEGKADFGQIRRKKASSTRNSLYLELSHLLQLEPELGHIPPHVEQALVEGRGAGGQGLAGWPQGLQGAESLPARNVGSSYEKRAAKTLRKPDRCVEVKPHPIIDNLTLKMPICFTVKKFFKKNYAGPLYDKNKELNLNKVWKPHATLQHALCNNHVLEA